MLFDLQSIEFKYLKYSTSLMFLISIQMNLVDLKTNIETFFNREPGAIIS